MFWNGSVQRRKTLSLHRGELHSHIRSVWEWVVHGYILKRLYHTASIELHKDLIASGLIVEILASLEGDWIQLARAVSKTWKDAIRVAESCCHFDNAIHDMVLEEWCGTECVWFISTRRGTFVYGPHPYGSVDFSYGENQSFHAEFAGFKPSMLHTEQGVMFDNVIRVAVDRSSVVIACTESGAIWGWHAVSLPIQERNDPLQMRFYKGKRIFDRAPRFTYPMGVDNKVQPSRLTFQQRTKFEFTDYEPI